MTSIIVNSIRVTDTFSIGLLSVTQLLALFSLPNESQLMFTELFRSQDNNFKTKKKIQPQSMAHMNVRYLLLKIQS